MRTISRFAWRLCFSAPHPTSVELVIVTFQTCSMVLSYHTGVVLMRCVDNLTFTMKTRPASPFLQKKPPRLSGGFGSGAIYGGSACPHVIARYFVKISRSRSLSPVFLKLALLFFTANATAFFSPASTRMFFARVIPV